MSTINELVQGNSAKAASTPEYPCAGLQALGPMPVDFLEQMQPEPGQMDSTTRRVLEISLDKRAAYLFNLALPSNGFQSVVDFAGQNSTLDTINRGRAQLFVHTYNVANALDIQARSEPAIARYVADVIHYIKETDLDKRPRYLKEFERHVFGEEIASYKSPGGNFINERFFNLVDAYFAMVKTWPQNQPTRRNLLTRNAKCLNKFTQMRGELEDQRSNGSRSAVAQAPEVPA